MVGDSGITRDSQNMGLRAVESAGQFQMRGAENAAQQIASLPAGFLAAQKQARDQQAQEMVLASEMADAQMRRQEVAQKMAMVTALRGLEMQGLEKKNAQMDLEFKRTQLETAMMEAENRGEISGADVAKMMASSPEAVFGENVLSIKPTASGRFTMESVRDPEKAKALTEQQQRSRHGGTPRDWQEESMTRGMLQMLHDQFSPSRLDDPDPEVIEPILQELQKRGFPNLDKYVQKLMQDQQRAREERQLPTSGPEFEREVERISKATGDSPDVVRSELLKMRSGK